MDAAYFRKSRERVSASRWKKSWPGRDKAVEGFRKSLDPLRLTLRTQRLSRRRQPNYADYIVFGAFQWARVVSPFKLLDRRRSGLCLARAAARRVRRHGAEVAGLSRLESRGVELTAGMVTFADVNQQAMIARMSGLSPRL